MDFAQLNAVIRKPEGKGAARRLRGSGVIPAVCYGAGQDTLALSVKPEELSGILKGKLGRNSVIQMKVDNGQEMLVMVRDFDHHPLGRHLLHADFIRVDLERDVEVEVPLVTTGRAAGVLKGGILNVVYRRLPVRCRPDKIPVQISIDVSDLDIGDGLTVAKLELPTGIRLALDSHQTIVSVTSPEAEEKAAEAAAEAAPAEGAAAAPADAAKAGAAAPAAGAAGAKPAAAGAKKEEAKKEKK